MSSQHQLLQVNQRFGDAGNALAALAPNFVNVDPGQVGSPVPFTVTSTGTDAFALIQGYDLDKAGLRVLLDGAVVGTINRGSNSGWSTLIVPLPDLHPGEHRLQFASASASDDSLVATAIIQWSPTEATIPNPFVDDSETIILRGWVNVDVQRQLGGSPDGDTLWLLDAEVVEDVRGIGAKVLANPNVNKKRTHPLGDINRLTIRFQGIDTPEIHATGSRQNYGFLAFAKLEEIGGMRFHAKRGDKSVEVRCSVTRQSERETILDPNQRVLGYVTLGELNANTEMVRLGYAFPFLYESISPAMQQRLRQYAEAASTAEAGVWREYTAVPVDPMPAVKEPIADYGQVNFPTFWRRWAEYRKSGGLPGPKFVEWVKANKEKKLAKAPGGIKLFSDTIDPSSNRLLVKPWEIVFEE